MVIKPKQRIPKKQKTEKWVEECAIYFSTEAKPILDAKLADVRYNVAYGKLEESEYLYVTNPRNTNRAELMGYPSKMRNIPIGPPIFAVLMGEKSKRFIDYQVIAINSDIESVKTAKETELVLKSMQEQFAQLLQAGPDGQPVEPLVRVPEQIKQEVDGIVDEVAIMGQQGVDYIRFYNDLDRKFKELFFDVLCQNCYVTYRDIRNGEVIFEVKNPKQISIVAGGDITFIEDAEVVTCKSRMSVNGIYDAFADFDGFEKKLGGIINQITGDTQKEGGTTRTIGISEFDSRFSNYNNSGAAYALFENLGLNRKFENFENGEYLDVEHIVWDSYVKVGILFNIDPVYGMVEVEVSEEYIPMEGEEVQWEWRKETWHAYLVNNDIVIGGEPLALTRAPKNSPNKSKKPYNGRILDGLSISDLVIPYQAKHNILNYYSEKLIGKHRGDIILFPMSLMPDGSNQAGVDFETSLHYMDADSIFMVDDSSKEALQALQYMKVLNSTLDSSLSQLLNYMANNKSELEEIIGINRFRKGQNNSSDGKFVSQQAEYRGSMMSEHLFTQIDEGHQKDLSYMLDLSQIAWIEGKTAHYVSSDFKSRFLEINPEKYSLAHFGVGINNSARATEKLNLMKQFTQALAQDPNTPKTAIPRLIDADNMATLIKELDKIIFENDRKMQAATEQEQLAEKEKQLNELEKVERSLDFNYYKTDADNRTKERVKEMDVVQAVGSMPEPIDNSVDQNLKSTELKIKHDIELKKMSLQKDIAGLKANSEKYKADLAYKIAKENKQ